MRVEVPTGGHEWTGFASDPSENDVRISHDLRPPPWCDWFGASRLRNHQQLTFVSSMFNLYSGCQNDFIYCQHGPHNIPSLCTASLDGNCSQLCSTCATIQQIILTHTHKILIIQRTIQRHNRIAILKKREVIMSASSYFQSFLDLLLFCLDFLHLLVPFHPPFSFPLPSSSPFPFSSCYLYHFPHCQFCRSGHCHFLFFRQQVDSGEG